MDLRIISVHDAARRVDVEVAHSAKEQNLTFGAPIVAQRGASETMAYEFRAGSIDPYQDLLLASSLIV